MKRSLPSQQYIIECLSYDPDTGMLFWRERPVCHFVGRRRSAAHIAANINSTRAGQPAFTAMANGYYTGAIDGRNYRAHRVIWKLVTGEEPDNIDHIDGDRANNRWINLRSVDRHENCKNACLRSDNTSGVIGVHWSTSRKKWVAQIKAHDKLVNLGRFDSRDDAVRARKAAEITYGFHKNHGRRPAVQVAGSSR